MKILKCITITIGLLGLSEYLQASGRAAKFTNKVAAKIGTAAVAAKIAAPQIAYAEGIQYRDQKQQTTSNNYASPSEYSFSKKYNQDNQFNNSNPNALSPTTIKLNDANRQITNLDAKPITIDMSSLNAMDTQSTISELDSVLPTQLPNETHNQTDNIPLSQDKANPLQFNFNNSFMYQKPTSGAFGFKGMPNSRSKITQQPQSGQLLLTYDQNFIPTKPEPAGALRENNITMQPEEAKSLTNHKNSELTDSIINTKDLMHDQEELNNKSETSLTQPEKAKNQPVVHDEQTTFKLLPQQVEQQKFDIDQMYINDKVNELSQSVENWPYYHDEFTSVEAHDNMLQEDILTSLGIKNEEGSLQVHDAQTDFKIVDALLEKYKDDINVTRVLTATLQTIHHQFTSQQATPRQANSVIAYYYTPELRNDIFSMMKLQPTFDPHSGAVTNMPSIEEITQAALKSPSQQAYKALQSALEATKISIYASRFDHSFFGDGSLLTQLKTFEKTINTTLQNPKLTQFQSWGTYTSSFIPSTRTILNAPIVRNVNVSTAVSTGKYVIDTVTPYVKTVTPLIKGTAQVAHAVTGAVAYTGLPYIADSAQIMHDWTGIVSGDATLSNAAKTTGLIPADIKTQTPAAEPKSPSIQENLNFDMSNKDINAIVVKNKSNNAIAQYYTPAMQHDVFILMGTKPRINPSTGIVENMPTIDDIVRTALEKPSQQSFNALQSVREAINVAQYASRGESSMLGKSQHLQQLQSFEKQITQALQNPKLAQFDSWTSQATSYIGSFLPSTKSILETTGLGNATINQTLNTAVQTPRIINQTISAVGLKPVADAASLVAEGAINYSGIPNMTLPQVYDYLYPPVTA